MDCGLPGSSVCGILQARVLEWVAISFSRDLPNPGMEPRSPALQADSLPSEPLGKNRLNKIKTICIHLEADCKPHKDSYLFEPVSPTLNVKDRN